MSGYVNKVILLGNAGKDPVMSTSRYGKRMARFSMATSKRWKDESGEKMESTVWHNVVVFNEDTAKEVERTVRKGTSVYVEGELANRKWTDTSNVERWVTEIVVSGSHHRVTAVDEMNSRTGEGAGSGSAAPPPDDRSSYGNTRPAQARSRAPDDDVPY
jgi:single-strand DNA-binding protein